MFFSKKLHQLISFFLSFSLLFQSFAPAIIYAQDATQSADVQTETVDPSPTPPEPTPTEIVILTPTEEITPTPTPSVANPPLAETPTEELTPTPSPTPDVTLTPELTPTPKVEATVTPEATPSPEPTLEPTQPVNETSPPTESTLTDEITPTETVTPTPSPEPSPTPSPTPAEPPVLVTDSSTNSLLASLFTDKLDYSPTDTVTITGTNLPPFQTLSITVSSTDDPAISFSDFVFTDGAGSFTYAYTLDGNYRPNYTIEVRASLGLTGAVVSTTFTDGQPADLDQWGNEAPVGWQNGNLNGNQADYFEGDSVAYRMKFDNLSLSSHTVTIGWDTTKAGKHALDYLTSYDQTETTDPCSGVSDCSGPATTFTIPDDLNIPADSNWTGSQISGDFSLFGGTITGVSPYTLINPYSGDSETKITITFTPSQANPVLAWGGHIATRADWGQNNSAISISGSPYHMRLRGLDGSGGNQDKSLSAEAVIFPASITIVKDSLLDDQQDFVFSTTGTGLSGFTLDDNGNNADETSNTKVFSVSDFGTKTVTEGVVGGWSLTGLVCSVTGTGSQSTNLGTRTATLGVEEGDVFNCTFTNTLQQAHLTLVKTLTKDNGGDASITDWTLSASGPTPISGTSGSGAITDATVNSGTYTISESGGPSGYTAGAWSCSGGTQDGNQITLAAGQSATCTINNNDNVPSLTLDKILVKDNGGTAVESDWTLTASGPTSLSGSGAAGSADVVSGPTFSAGTYTLSESADQTGYLAGTWSCTGGSQNGNQITLDLGESATCTITNDDITPTLTLVKTVTNNNGGDSVTSDFTLKIDSTTVTSGVATTVGAGAHTASEVTLPGYTPSVWGGDCNADGTITLNPGDAKTCTITNDDVAPSLTLDKILVKDNGGTASESDWTLTATGNQNSPVILSGPGATGSTDVVSGPTFSAGTYTLSESAGPSGYSASSWSCTGNGSQNGGQITLGLGESATCTITNDDVAPSLTLVKVVDDDNGGSAIPANWTLTARGPVTLSGAGGAQSDSSFQSGTYTLSESVGPSGYVSGDWTCEGGIHDGDQITLDLGESATCSITNTAQKGNLRIIKNTLGDNGSFPFDISGPTALSTTITTIDGEGETTIPVIAGEYSVIENTPGGWYLDSATCDQGTPDDLNIDLGETVTCTFTNTRYGMISGFKYKTNADGSTISPLSDWLITLYLDSNPILSQNTTVLGAFSFIDLLLGSYSLTENMPSGWTQIYSPGTIDLAAGQVSEENNFGNFDNGYISGYKYETDTENPLNDWIIRLSFQDSDETPNCPDPGVINGQYCEYTTGSEGTDGHYIFRDLGPGTYIVDEVDQDGWTQTSPSEPNYYEITMTSNGAKSGRNFFNERDTGTVTIIKNVDNNNDGDVTDEGDVQGATDWTWNIEDGEQGISTGSDRVLDTGDYVISETDKDNYHLVSWECDNDSAGEENSIDISLTTDSVACTITNARDTGTISGYKWNDLDGDGGWGENESGLGDWMIELRSDNDGQPGNLIDFTTTDDSEDIGFYSFDSPTGDYFVCEDNQAGWQQTTPLNQTGNCYPISLTSDGQTESGNNFGNRGLGTITVHKAILGTQTDATQFCFTLIPDPNKGQTCANADGDAIFNDVPSGSYTASETAAAANYTETETTCDQSMTITNGGDELSCTVTNTRDQGTVTFEKIVDDESDVSAWNFTIDGVDGTFQSGDQVTLDTGTYTVTEFGSSDYTPDSATGICGSLDGSSATLTITKDGGTCTFTNLVNKGTITVTKLTNPAESEESFDFSLDGESSDATSLFDGESYSFENLFPGNYSLSEDTPDGWDLTASCFDEEENVIDPSSISLDPGETINCTFTNTYVPPKLNLSKTNDASTDRTPGGSVTFTLTLSVFDNDINNVIVRDLPAKGFSYRPGSWIVFSNLQGFMTITQPAYNSPGDWNLGNLSAGEIVTLSYIADIDTAQTPGLYNDLAWANGQAVGGPVTAAGTDGAFVGTQVNVVKNNQDTPTREVEQKVEGQVLGATTSLPATGADTHWLYLALILGLLGTTSSFAGIILKRKHE